MQAPSVKPMNEIEQASAVRIAHAVLARVDPKSDIAVLARQLLSACETIDGLRRPTGTREVDHGQADIPIA